MRSIPTWRLRRCGNPAAKGCWTRATRRSAKMNRARAMPTQQSTRGADGEVFDPVTKADHELVARYRKGVAKGMLKVMAKIGISTIAELQGRTNLRSSRDCARRWSMRCFSRNGQPHSGGKLRRAWPRKHYAAMRLGYPQQPATARLPILPNPGEFHWRAARANATCGTRSRSPIFKWQRATGERRTPTSGSPITSNLDDAATRCHAAGTLEALRTARKRWAHSSGRSASRRVGNCEAVLHRRDVASDRSLPKRTKHLPMAMNRMGGKSNTGEGR